MELENYNLTLSQIIFQDPLTFHLYSKKHIHKQTKKSKNQNQNQTNKTKINPNIKVVWALKISIKQIFYYNCS